MKHKFEIFQNTDNVDIRASALGLSVSIGDVNNPMLNDRGLTIQIRHNKDKATFEVASQVSQLIAAAPELLEIAKAYRNLLRTAAHTDGQVATFQHIEAVLAKAEGK